MSRYSGTALAELIEVLGDGLLFTTITVSKELYRYLNDRIESDTQVMPYIKSLKEYSSVYAALQNPDDSFWKEYGNGRYLECTEDLRVLRLLAVVSVRYNVICQKSANEQEALYKMRVGKYRGLDFVL